jgi:hypothetical protein
MGASGWAYFVPYQPNIDLALQELRYQVFHDEFQDRELLFSRAELLAQLNDELDHLETLYPDPQVRATLEQKFLDQKKRLTTPLDHQKVKKGINKLLKQSAEDGTHSILDIKNSSPQPEFGAVAPLSAIELQAVFGTEHPTRSMIEAKADQLMGLRERWSGTYIIVYHENQPTEIYFTGYSGD